MKLDFHLAELDDVGFCSHAAHDAHWLGCHDARIGLRVAADVRVPENVVSGELAQFSSRCNQHAPASHVHGDTSATCICVNDKSLGGAEFGSVKSNTVFNTLSNPCDFGHLVAAMKNIKCVVVGDSKTDKTTLLSESKFVIVLASVRF